MDRITQEAYYRQRVLKYAAKHGVTRAAERYRMSRKTVHKWKRRYDGTIESLKNRSRAPLHSPLKQSDWEIQLVQRYAKKYPRDLLLGYEKARKNGYARSYGCFKRTASKLRPPEKKNRAQQNKPYERAAYPGQKIQVDVKFVPSYCVANGQKYYQFTAKDECTRWTYREMYEEHSTHSAWQFLLNLVRTAPFPIRMIQTDNGTEFTNALLVTKSKHKTLFESALIEMGIAYHRIQIATPRHNGKVERQHRTDELRFYRHMRMYSLENDSDLDFSRYTELTDALRAGRNVDGAIKELADHGHDEKDVAARVKSITGDLYAKGEISQSQAQSLLKKYGRKTSGGILAVLDDTDVWGAMNQMEYRKLTGESSASDYALLYYAISNQRSPQAYIDDALAHGKSRSSIASGVTSRFKEEYQRLLKTDLNAASVLKGRLCAAFDYLGYNGLKKVGDWEK